MPTIISRPLPLIRRRRRFPPSVTAADPPLVPGTASVTARTAAGVSFSATASTGGSGTGRTYQWERSTGRDPDGTWGDISGATSLTLTDHVPPDTELYWFRVRCDDDALNGPVWTNTVAAQLKIGLVVGLIGDSILVHDPSDGSETAGAAIGRYLETLLGDREVTVDNEAISSTSTTYWLPDDPSGALTTAIASFTASGVDVIAICLGHNDAGFGALVATFTANMAEIIAELQTELPGVPIVLLGLISPNADLWGSGAIPERADLMGQMNDAQPGLANGTTVFCPDGFDSVFRHYSMNPTTMLESDGIHPLDAGVQYGGEAWAGEIYQALYGVEPGGGGGGTIFGGSVIR